jgi:precorrin-6A/cobalt-precorrin-6A reductase
MKPSILILGGTTEARELGGRLAGRADLAATLSLAGRTQSPAPQSIPVRTGGFGGIEGLVRYLEDQRIHALIDATHPYAAIISAHALAAAKQTRTSLLFLQREPWVPIEGDRWTEARDVVEAVQMLGSAPRRPFLALGRQEITPFLAAPQHHYTIRTIEPLDPSVVFLKASHLTQRGPFDAGAERELLQEHGIDLVVSKNSGGTATYGKIIAARELGIPVLMIRRPARLEAHYVTRVDEAISWLDHLLAVPTERGV